MNYNYSNSNRRRNNNTVYVVLLIVSLIAIIIVAGIFLITELKKKNNAQNDVPTNGGYVSEVYPSQSYPAQPFESTGSVEVPPIETAPVIPNDTLPVQTVSEYDLNSDGVAEAVTVAVDKGSSQATISVGKLGNLTILLEPIGVNSFQHLTVAGINLKNDKRLAAIEYTYIDGGMGLVKCHVWSYVNGGFVKNSEILYSGLIGNQGFMDSGVIENRVPEDRFGYVAEENKNGYIYERSRVIADMRDLGIKLPFETVGQYTIGYDRNVTFFYDVNLP